jgi:hypothetical protein
MAVEPTSKLQTEKAQEAQVRANEMSADLARNTTLRIAASYDKLAEYAALGEKAGAAHRKLRRPEAAALGGRLGRAAAALRNG